MTGHRKRRGAVLAVVVALAAFLAALVAIGALAIRDGLGLVALSRDEIQSEALIHAGVEIGAGLIAPNPRFAAAGEPLGYSLGVGRVLVSIISEDGKVDLNRADPQLLEGLFLALGAGTGNAREAAGLIAARRNRAAQQPLQTLADPARTSPGVGRPSSGFRDPTDLRMIPGLSSALVEQALPFVTVLSKSGTIYALGAPATVLAALPGMTIQRARQVVEARQQNPSDWTMIRSILGGSAGYAREDRGTAFTLNVEAELRGGYKDTAEVVIVASGEQAVPYRVVTWKPGFGAAAQLSGRAVRAP
jgi:general secretion pathway protein K